MINKIHACSFASKNYLNQQTLQKDYFLKAGFKKEQIHLCNPSTLGDQFYLRQPNAREVNKFGWFTFKPFLLNIILESLEIGDIVLYLDVNDKPLNGIREYLTSKFSEKKELNFLASTTNYANIRFLSSFHKLYLTKQLLLSSIFFSQPEAGALAIRNTLISRSILRAWYEMTLMLSFSLEESNEIQSRHDQETLFLLSRTYKCIKFDSWLKYKITGKGLRKYIKFEEFRNK